MLINAHSDVSSANSTGSDLHLHIIIFDLLRQLLLTAYIMTDDSSIRGAV